jgi:hypothetical protein
MSRKRAGGKFNDFMGAAKPETEAAKGRRATKGKGIAKRDDPDYKQALAYVRRDTHRRVMARLAETEGEYSDLVEKLLTGWLDARK